MKRKSHSLARLASGALLLTLLLSACAAASPPEPTLVSSPALPTAPAATVEPTSPPPTLLPTVTSTPPPTPTPTLHPMMIEAQRAVSYPGSEIVIEQELERGSNYQRYYAYYLSEGLKIYGLLTIPDAEMPSGGWPAIVFNHGYIPPTIYRTTERYVAYVDRLASSGYVVFRIDYRGHDRSEGSPSGAYGSPGYLTDVLNAATSLRQHPQVNPEKIGLWGHSMGGYLTLRAMVIDPGIRAGVIWAGVVGSYPDMMYNWRRSGSVPTPPSGARRWRQAWVEEFGTPEQNPAFWSAVSANTYLEDLSGPVQLHHGENDEDVPFEFSIELADEINAAGGVVELYTYPGDDHNISNYFTTAMNNTIDFYDRYLK